MSPQPLEKVQNMREVYSGITAMPAGSVLGVAQPRRSRVAGPVGEALAYSTQLVDSVREITERQVGGVLSLEEQKLALQADEVAAQREELRDAREARADDRKARQEERRQGGPLAMFQLMQQMLGQAQGGSTEELRALRADVIAMRERTERQEFDALMEHANQESANLRAELQDIKARMFASDDPLPREVARVREVQEQLRGLRELFGVTDGQAQAQGDVQVIMLQARIAEDRLEAQHKRDMERDRWELEKAERYAAVTKSGRMADQIDTFLEGLAPFAQSIAEKYAAGSQPTMVAQNTAREMVGAPLVAAPMPPAALPDGIEAVACMNCGQRVLIMADQTEFVCPQCATPHGARQPGSEDEIAGSPIPIEGFDLIAGRSEPTPSLPF